MAPRTATSTRAWSTSGSTSCAARAIDAPPAGCTRLPRDVTPARPVQARRDRPSCRGRACRSLEQGPVQHVRPQPAHARERARRRPRHRHQTLRLPVVEHGLRQLHDRERRRGAPAESDRDLRRAQALGREDRDRVPASVRPALHDHPAVGAVRRALRQPSRRPGLHRDRAGERHAAHRRRRRRAHRLHVHRGSRRRASAA